MCHYSFMISVFLISFCFLAFGQGLRLHLNAIQVFSAVVF